MQCGLKKLDINDLDLLVDFNLSIYENVDPNKYPDFKIANDISERAQAEKFFRAFLLPSSFNDFNIRQVYAVVDEDGIYQAAVGVRRWDHLPSWSVGWLLSPRKGHQFISIFRQTIELLCKVHEDAGMNEFFVSYPESREPAYSKIMLPFRERYYSFVECTVPAKERSPYGFIHELMGSTLHPHNMNLRRYILRRPNTEPSSEGGKHSKKNK